MNNWTPPNPAYPPPKPGEPPLFTAARTGDHDAIRRLIAAGVPIDGLFDMGLDSGAQPDPCTPLIVAAGSGDGATVETVKLLLSLGADPGFAAKYGSAAKRACAGLGWNYRPGGDAERLRVLLEARSPLELTGRAGARLLADTAATGDAARLAILIDAGAPVNPVFDPLVAKQEWATHLSCILGTCSPDSAAPLDDELNAATSEMLHELNENMASAPSGYEVPLMRAASSGSAACVRLLLNAGADIRIIDNMRRSVMFYAGSPEVVRTLAEAGVDLHHVDDLDKDAVQHLVENMGSADRDLSTVASTCAAMIDVGIPLVLSVDRRHRLYDAAFAENEHAVRWLLSAGHGSVPREDGATALHAICWHWDHGDERDLVTRAIVRMLLDAGIDPCARGSGGDTPLHNAIAGDGVNLIAAEELLKAGADVNAQNDDGQTPLVYFYEILFDYAKVVPFLLKHGANPLIPNNRGKNAIDIARQMIAGENPDWRTEQWNEEGGPPCGWKEPAESGSDEHRMLELLIQAAQRFRV